jgi:coenzyme F420-reducing hydrogenase alpha subunit
MIEYVLSWMIICAINPTSHSAEFHEAADHLWRVEPPASWAYWRDSECWS